jgi:hypothetical protein
MFLVYIVLALIAAATIQILFNIFYPFNKTVDQNESFADTNYHNKNPDQIDRVDRVDHVDRVERVDHVDHVDYDNSMTPSRDCISKDGLINCMPHLTKSKDCNTYEKEFMDEKCAYQADLKKYSRDELHEYRDKFIGFRSYINQSSADVDPVDRINEQLYSEDDMYGEKIGDRYDYLVNGKKCILDQDIDQINMSPKYKMAGTFGDYYTKDNWVYNCDSVMNGAVFYDNISGTDPEVDPQMAVN